jgi:hypothetical protein
MTVALFKRGGKTKIQGHLATRLDCAEDRVDELLAAGWHRSVREAYVKPKPAEKVYAPLPKPKKKKKKFYSKD